LETPPLLGRYIVDKKGGLPKVIRGILIPRLKEGGKKTPKTFGGRLFPLKVAKREREFQVKLEEKGPLGLPKGLKKGEKSAQNPRGPKLQEGLTSNAKGLKPRKPSKTRIARYTLPKRRKSYP